MSSAKRSRYKWVTLVDGTQMYEVGIEVDGSLFNPRGYPDDEVRAAVLAANERRRQRRSNGAKKAAETRRERTAARVYQAAKRLTLAGGNSIGPRGSCFICRRRLGDSDSINRGIGSECWQDVLDCIAAVPS
jgi:hypothetical protein